MPIDDAEVLRRAVEEDTYVGGAGRCGPVLVGEIRRLSEDAARLDWIEARPMLLTEVEVLMDEDGLSLRDAIDDLRESHGRLD